ncbi:MAG: PAS domain S-box protein [Verrucomicrobiota bacterium]
MPSDHFRVELQPLILVVDPDAAARQKLVLLLSSMGLQVQESTSGNDAWQLLYQQRPNLVLLAHHRAGLDADAFCVQIKSEPDFAEVGVVFMDVDQPVGVNVGKASSMDRADGHIRLPISDEDMLERIGIFLRLQWAESALWHSERKYRALLEMAQDGMALLSQDGTVRFANVTLARILGHPSSDLSGTSLVSFFDEASRQLMENWLMEGSLRRGQQREFTLMRPDHTEVRVQAMLTDISDSSVAERELLFMARDVTVHRQTEEKLRQLFRATEQSPATIVITDVAGAIEYVNPKFSSVTGYSSKEALGKNPRILKSGVQGKEFYLEMWQTLTAGKEWRGEFHNRKKDGTIYWESASISPLRNEVGQITHYIAVKEDISLRKQLEEEREQLVNDLREALANVKTLSGLLPICASCKRIRDDRGYWETVEGYVGRHSGARFSHGMCPECAKKWLQDAGLEPPVDKL